jgi:hypothetical protein
MRNDRTLSIGRQGDRAYPLRYFRKVADGFDVGPALLDLLRDPDLQVPVPEPDGTAAEAEGTGVLYPGKSFKFVHHPAIQTLLERALDALKVDIGDFPTRPRVRVIPAGSRMKPHRDRLKTIVRYQLAMQCDDSAYFVMRTGPTRKEVCRFRSGELWHVDVGSRTHYVVNDSTFPRIVMVIDVVTEGDTPAHAAQNYGKGARHEG